MGRVSLHQPRKKWIRGVAKNHRRHRSTLHHGWLLRNVKGWFGYGLPILTFALVEVVVMVGGGVIRNSSLTMTRGKRNPSCIAPRTTQYQSCPATLHKSGASHHRRPSTKNAVLGSSGHALPACRVSTPCAIMRSQTLMPTALYMSDYQVTVQQPL